MNNLLLLPTDIQLMIVDFLSIDDCFALIKINSKFFQNLRVSNAFWAQKLFQRHIQCSEKTINMFKSSGSKLPYYSPSAEEFKNFGKGKLCWEDLLENKETLISSFIAFGLDGLKGQQFANRIYSVLINPPLPIPSLKRETQSIPTSSSFENFLTEIHFEISLRPRFYDSDYLFMIEASDAIKADFAAIQNDSIKKPKTNKRKSGRKNKKMQKSAHKAKITDIRKNIKERNHVRKVQEIYFSIQDFLKSHCIIIRNYLLSLNQDRILLKEYSRCWNEFTYSMIELHNLMQPYEELFGGVDAFSTWKGMVKLWTDEVYNNVGIKVKESFQKLLIDTIIKEVTINDPSKKHNKPENIVEDQKDHHKVTKTLLKSFIALSDISLWKTDFKQYDPIDLFEVQPKLRLINFIYPNIKVLVEATEAAFDEDPYKRDEIFNRIKSIFNTVFNEEISMEEISNEETCGEALDKDISAPFQEIAGKYKIVSRCKWDNRLSQVYDSINEMNVC